MFAYTEAPYTYPAVLLLAFLYGVGAGLLYEIFRILRSMTDILFPIRSKVLSILHVIVVFWQDLLYFGILSATGVLFLYVFNRGQLRISLILMMALGLCLYLVTIGKWIYGLHRFILSVTYRLLRFLYMHSLYYLFVFLGYLYRKTIGKAFLYVIKKGNSLYLKVFGVYRRRRLDRFIKDLPSTLCEPSEHLSIH